MFAEYRQRLVQVHFLLNVYLQVKHEMWIPISSHRVKYLQVYFVLQSFFSPYVFNMKVIEFIFDYAKLFLDKTLKCVYFYMHKNNKIFINKMYTEKQTSKEKFYKICCYF